MVIFTCYILSYVYTCALPPPCRGALRARVLVTPQLLLAPRGEVRASAANSQQHCTLRTPNPLRTVESENAYYARTPM